MLRKSFYLIILVALAGVIAFLVLENSSSVDVVYGYKEAHTLKGINLGVVLISCFVIGFAIAWIFASLLLLRGLLQRKKVEFDKNRKEKFVKSIITAREHHATGDWDKSVSAWKALKKHDPSEILANLEIAQSLEAAGKVSEALKVLDEARAKNPDNLEVLFRSVDLNVQSGNKTVALDNLALILTKEPNQKAAVLARNYSEQIGRYQDALEYNQKAFELGDLEDFAQASARLELALLDNSADLTSPEGRAKYAKDLKKLIKKHKSCAEPMVAFARFNKSQGNYDEAAEWYFKASQIEKNSSLWHSAVELWIEHDSPDKAIATAKTIIKNSKGINRLQAELDLIRVNIALAKLEEAKELLDGFPDLVDEQGYELSDQLKMDYFYVKGLCHNRLGQDEDAAKIWLKLSSSDLSLERCLQSRQENND